MAQMSSNWYPYDELQHRQVRMFKLDPSNDAEMALSGVLHTVYLHHWSESSITAETGFRDYMKSIAKAGTDIAGVFFADDPKMEGFDALSYTWGPDNEPGKEAPSLSLRRHASLTWGDTYYKLVPHGDIKS